jgi:hypothetical protein
MMARKTLYIVGNGPVGRDMSAEIDAADFVVRFNEPKASIGMSGVKTDILFLCNAGKPMQRRLETPDFLASAIVRNAGQVILAYHPIIIDRYFPKPNFLSRLKGRREDWTFATIMALGGIGKASIVFPASFYMDGCRELGLPDDKMASVYPSTGYFGIFYALRHFSAAEWAISLCGFSWEGWKRHAWADERKWVEDRVRQGLLTMIE